MAKKTIDTYIQEELPFRHLKCLTGFDNIIREMSEIIKDENVPMKLKIHAATVKMQAYKHTLEIMDMIVGVDSAIKFLDRYREDTLTQIRKSKGDESAYTFEELVQRRREAVF
jgi:hydrogenase maturation factor HypE